MQDFRRYVLPNAIDWELFTDSDFKLKFNSSQLSKFVKPITLRYFQRIIAIKANYICGFLFHSVYTNPVEHYKLSRGFRDML